LALPGEDQMPRYGRQKYFRGEVIYIPDRSRHLLKVPEETEERECLKCGKSFMSYSKCHRLCDSCHAENEFEYQPPVLLIADGRVRRRF